MMPPRSLLLCPSASPLLMPVPSQLHASVSLHSFTLLSLHVCLHFERANLMPDMRRAAVGCHTTIADTLPVHVPAITCMHARPCSALLVVPICRSSCRHTVPKQSAACAPCSLHATSRNVPCMPHSHPRLHSCQRLCAISWCGACCFSALKTHACIQSLRFLMHSALPSTLLPRKDSTYHHIQAH